MKKLISIIALAAFAFALPAQEILLARELGAQRYQVAVLEIQTNGRISEAEAMLLSSRLQEELQKFDIFEVTNSQEVERVLNANNISPTNCASTDCGIQAGRALGVRLVVNGTVRKVGQLYFLDIRIMHVASGEIVQNVKEEFDGKMNKLLDYMAVVARKLVGLSPTDAKMVGNTQTVEPVAEPQSGSMTVGEMISAPENSASEPAPEKQVTMKKGSSMKWAILGALVAGGVGAGVILSKKDNGGTGGGGQNNETLPIPPNFP